MSPALFFLYLILGWIGYLLAGRLTAGLWNRWVPAALPDEEVQAIRILWWVFLPLGMFLYMNDFVSWGLERLIPTGEEYPVDWSALVQTAHSEDGS